MKLAKSEWPRMIPASTLLCVAPVALLLLLKGLTSLPPGSWILGRVHSGGAWAAAVLVYRMWPRMRLCTAVCRAECHLCDAHKALYCIAPAGSNEV